uniref:NADH-ubiquinone oxidoreductase chain 5 n=1 Tax=Solenocera crassicornis TaxID=228863 RepID=A0A172W6K6_9EUCA|nr:NADH dehydrogenase subunit 5 [Solenocera crassicornis]YP_010580174.1 NADH dehydrogenase subunit 5 [Solenocera melantho]ANF05078.1 NADH dehydrogenase subunit 5 [Solenocera crassicornis]UZS90558.1 NADH dehydrogenase subunit 5 [Solenocera melantho]
MVSMYLSSMLFLLTMSVISLFCSLFCLMKNCAWFIEWELVSLNSSSIEMTLILDWMSLMFLSFVTFISSMVLYYSGEYMAADNNMNRFMYLVLAFVMSMGFLIISPNLISILLGWDGLGLVSYALVIYYQNEKSSNAGMLTALSNRIGDVCILLAISLFFSYGGWNFLFYVNMMSEMKMKEVLCGLMVLAGMTKSAQIPFSAWLPAAMAAPTPVSALVHSSTLVTAGVYLLIRFSPALSGSNAQIVLLLLSSMTMFMAGLGANFEYDLKKIIALSTLSQLGVMMSILSLGFPDLAFFHLLAHALFKALLFMCAGAVIHSVKDYQDIRMMGGLVYHMPLTGMCMNLANLALCGTPFLAGFYSKDMILEVAFMSSINLVVFILYALATGLTVCYTMRLVYYTLSGDFNLGNLYSIGDNAFIMTSPMMCLVIGAVFGGAGLSWLIFPCPYMICMSLFFKTLALSVSLVGGFIGYMLNMMAVSYELNSLNMYNSTVFYGSMWFMPFLSTYGVSKDFLVKGDLYQKVGDSGWSEYYGGQGIYSFIMSGSMGLQMLQDNSMKVYMLSFMLWLIILFFIFF